MDWQGAKVFGRSERKYILIGWTGQNNQSTEEGRAHGESIMCLIYTLAHTHMHTLGHNAFLTVDPVQKLCASHWLVQIPTFPSTFYAASSEKETS